MSESSQGREKLKQTTGYLYAIGIIGISSLSAYYLIDKFYLLNESLRPWAIAAALFYVAGRVVDDISTVKIMDAVMESEELGIPQYIRERNLDLPARPTKQDLFRPKVLIWEAAFLISSIIYPPSGFGYGLASFYAAFHNNQMRKEIKRDINNINNFK